MLALPRRGQVAEKLRRPIACDREHLFVFLTDRAVPTTNDVSQRALGPSAIARPALRWRLEHADFMLPARARGLRSCMIVQKSD